MSIEAAIVTLLESDEAVGSLIGAGDDARIYPVVVSRAAGHPALTYQCLNAERGRATDGPTEDVRGTWQIVIWAETYSELPDLVERVRRALDGAKGAYGGTQIEHCLIAGESDTAAVDPENEELVFYARQLNFDIWWKEDF